MTELSRIPYQGPRYVLLHEMTDKEIRQDLLMMTENVLKAGVYPGHGFDDPGAVYPSKEPKIYDIIWERFDYILKACLTEGSIGWVISSWVGQTSPGIAIHHNVFGVPKMDRHWHEIDVVMGLCRAIVYNISTKMFPYTIQLLPHSDTICGEAIVLSVIAPDYVYSVDYNPGTDNDPLHVGELLLRAYNETCLDRFNIPFRSWAAVLRMQVLHDFRIIDEDTV